MLSSSPSKIHEPLVTGVSGDPCTGDSARKPRNTRGCQYTSSAFARFCADNQIKTSAGRTGVCWDNAAPRNRFLPP